MNHTCARGMFEGRLIVRYVVTSLRASMLSTSTEISGALAWVVDS